VLKGGKNSEKALKYPTPELNTLSTPQGSSVTVGKIAKSIEIPETKT